MKYLGKRPPQNGGQLNEEHMHGALVEAADVVKGWMEAIPIRDEHGVTRDVRLAPNLFHLKNLARYLRISAGEEEE